MPAKATKRPHAVALEETTRASLQQTKAARKQSGTRGGQGNPPAQPINAQLQSQLDVVAKSLCKAPGLPPFVSRMLGLMIPKSLAEPEDERGRHQQRVVEMISLSLKRTEAVLQQALTEAQSSVDTAAPELDALTGRVAAALASLAEKQEAHHQAAAKKAEHSAGLRVAEGTLERKKEERAKTELRIREGLRRKTLLKDAAEFAVAPWKAGTLEISSALEWSEKMLAIQERLQFDTSVIVAAKSVLANFKGAEGARSTFDSIVMDELEAHIGKSLETLDADIHSAEGTSQDQAAAVETAEAVCDQSREVLRESCESVTSLLAAVDAAKAEVATSQQAAKDFSSELSRKRDALQAARASLTSFQTGPRFTFDKLQKRAAGKSV